MSKLIILIYHGLKPSVCFYHLSSLMSKTIIINHAILSFSWLNKSKLLTDFNYSLICEFALLFVFVDFSFVLINTLFIVWRVLLVLFNCLYQIYKSSFKISLLSFPSIWSLVFLSWNFSKLFFLKFCFDFKSFFFCLQILSRYK